MTLNTTEIGELADSIRTESRNEWSRLATLQKRIEGKLNRTWMPDNADLEYKDLLRKSASPWLEFVRDAISQGLRIDGFSSEKVWKDGWQANAMDGRQGAINREIVGLGKSYGMSIPAATAGEAVMRPLSALRTFAKYRDPWDEYPEYVLHRASRQRAQYWEADWLLLDETSIYRFKGDPRRPENLRTVAHNLDFTPVVMLSNTLSLDGEPRSSVEAAIPVYQRVVDATFTLQMVQRYGAFPQKWMAGGEIARDENGNSLVRSAVDGLLHASGVSGETARFGNFQSANLTDVVSAVDAHIKHLSAVCQVPPHYLLGAVVNMSAEGIAAAESGYYRNIGDRQDAIGEGYELWLRTTAAILNDPAKDEIDAQVHWEDLSSRSLGQIADAVGKLGAQGAPLELLFAMIPGWSKTDAIEAASYASMRQQALAAASAPPEKPQLEQ